MSDQPQEQNSTGPLVNTCRGPLPPDTKVDLLTEDRVREIVREEIEKTIGSLEKRCLECEGRGSWPLSGRCGICHGTGAEPSPLAGQILALVRRHWKRLLTED